MAACDTGVLALLERVCSLEALEEWEGTDSVDGDGNDDEGMDVQE